MRTRSIDALLRLARELTDASTARGVLPLLPDAALDLTGAKGSAVLELTPAGLELVAQKGLPASLDGWIEDADAIGPELESDVLRLAGPGFARARAIPMVSSGNLFGALVLFFDDATAMSPDVEKIAHGLVDLAASAIAKAAQHAELARAHDELRSSQDTLLRVEKLRALGEMAAGLSHDLKNLFGPLLLHLQVATRALARREEDDVKAAIAECQAIVRRSSEMLERLRDFSRQSPESRVDPSDLNRLVHDAAEIAKPRMASRGGRVSKIVEEPGTVPRVPLRASEVVSAIVNLIVNAIDATPQGGTITLRTGVDQGRAFVTVADSGPGIAPDVQKKVFEPFFTTKGDAGTGLGLSMVFACMQRHGGSVTLKTAPGEGAAFTLWFPIPVE